MRTLKRFVVIAACYVCGLMMASPLLKEFSVWVWLVAGAVGPIVLIGALAIGWWAGDAFSRD